MKNSGLVSLIVALIALGVAGYTAYTSHAKNKVAFIELQRVFNEFEMTKEYKTKLETVVNARKAVADSLELTLKAQSRAISQMANENDVRVQSFLYDKEMYLQKVNQFQEDNMAMKQKYDGEINKQLNQYVKEYGEKNGYQFIYGADGSGVIMQAQAKYNISAEIIEYINKRYKGEPK